MPFHPQPLLFLALGLAVGTLVPCSDMSSLLGLALGLAALLAVVAILRPGVVPLTALMVAAGASGAALGAGARDSYLREALPGFLGGFDGAVILEGRVAGDPQLVDGEMRFEAEASRVIAMGVAHEYHGRVRVFVRSQTASPPPSSRDLARGDHIEAWVEIRAPEPVRTPGGFDQLAWAMRQGVHAFASCKSERLLRVIEKGRAKPSLIDRARAGLKESWRHVDDPLDRAVTASMVLGDEGALDATTREEFRSAGLLHLLVVSGSQVAALIIGLRRLMPRALRIAWSGCLLECAALVAYCLVAGAGDSIVRATVMAIAFAVAVRVDLHRGGANFLFGAALALLVLRPLDALDPGAQMSFAATLALVSFAAPVSRRLAERRVPGLIGDVLAATLVATIAVTPLSLFHFHRFSFVALPANLLAAPLAGLLLYGSLATAFLDALFAPLAPLCGAVCGLIAGTLRSLAHLAASWDPDWRGPCVPLVLLIGVAGLAAGSGRRRFILPIAGLAAALNMSGLPLGDGRLHVWFLDVGQGDAILIETPTGRVAAIDAGPSFEGFDAGERVVAPALWELGHRRLAFLGVTHRHADHEGGAPFLARHFDPGRIYVNAPSTALRGLPITTIRKGDAWSVDGVAFRALGPDADWQLPSRDENARSLVIEMRYGRTSFLLLGDASVLTESLLDLEGSGYDLVKAGHHGASTSSSQRLVSATRPR
ncbi:MAG: ComEC/Rec2 family competence protein, partial [Vicinamibacteria bacterium]